MLKLVPMKGYEKEYVINRDGEIFSLLTKKFKKSCKCPIYFSVSLYRDGRGSVRTVHSLVAENFLENKGKIGRSNDSFQVNHIDGDKSNNCVENLEYITHIENKKHAALKGLTSRGERQHLHKLTEDSVKSIRKNYIPRINSQRMLAKKYGVSQATIKEVLHKETWKFI